MSNVGTTQRRPSGHVELSRRIVWKICRLVSRKRVLIEIKSVIHSSTYRYSLDSFMYFCAFCIRIDTHWYYATETILARRSFFRFCKNYFRKITGLWGGGLSDRLCPFPSWNVQLYHRYSWRFKQCSVISEISNRKFLLQIHSQNNQTYRTL